MNTDDPVSPSSLMLQTLTTEHFTLQGARSVVMSEITGRATIYLSAVSSSVVALAFVTSISQDDDLVRGFALVLLPLLSFMGFVTKERLNQLSYADFQYHKAINRIRHAYVDVAPDAARYLTLSIYDDLSGVAQSAVYRQGRRMSVLTAAQMIAVVNYVIIGVSGGILFDWVAGLPVPYPILFGLGMGLVVALLDFRIAHWRWAKFLASSETRFPSPADEAAP
ncbi:MAG: hypothetical protein KA586_00785 [Candidatus Promineofilum sp.]|nr:hypothetical protein [Promineifilum sp.]